MYNHFFKKTSIQGSIFECEALSPTVAQQHNIYLLDGKNVHTYMILLILTGKTLTPQVMPHIYQVALFPLKQWHTPQDALCSSLRSNDLGADQAACWGQNAGAPGKRQKGKEKNFQMKEKSYEMVGRENQSLLPGLASPGDHVTDQYNMEQCHTLHSSLRSDPVELRKTCSRRSTTRNWLVSTSSSDSESTHPGTESARCLSRSHEQICR